MMQRVKSFMMDEEGATAVEYGVVVALVIAAAIAAIKTLGTTVNGAFTSINGELSGGNGQQP